MAKLFQKSVFRTIRKQWWVGLLYIIWWLGSDRIAGWANDKIDEVAEPRMEYLMNLLVDASTAPMWWSLAVFLMILAALVCHSYYVEYQHQTSSRTGNEDREKASQIDEPPSKLRHSDSSQWANFSRFKLYQAACLWDGRLPQKSKENDPESPTLEMLKQAILERKLNISDRNNAMEKVKIEMARSVGGDESGISDNILVERSDLKKFSESIGVRPPLLFSNERKTDGTR